MRSDKIRQMERERLLCQLRAHKSSLVSKHRVKRLALFGSWARAEQTRTSDVDIMVEFEGRVGWEVVDLQEELEQLLGKRVDLVTRNALQSKPRLWSTVERNLIDV
ncbi:MAG: nucleotidyltransferase family protein [Armatimonadota bacterium]